MRRFAGLLVVALLPSSVEATTCESFEGGPVDEKCNIVSMWPCSRPVEVLVRGTYYCCTPMDDAGCPPMRKTITPRCLGLFRDQPPSPFDRVTGTFVELNRDCGGDQIFRFDRLVPPGDYGVSPPLNCLDGLDRWITFRVVASGMCAPPFDLSEPRDMSEIPDEAIADDLAIPFDRALVRDFEIGAPPGGSCQCAVGQQVSFRPGSLFWSIAILFLLRRRLRR